ncbi:MAG: carbohydrate binding family 9 domain-containing protein [Acidobacteriales bacterium]|nr:carbohydrate binding family 9 domain-containing protein [Terriglobales bacterium]
MVVAVFLSAVPAALPQVPSPAASESQRQSETPASAPQRLAVDANHDDNLVIPRLPHGPTLDDFLSMKPAGEAALAMAKVARFLQREPHDGEPVSESTEVYLGYDDKNLYAVFVCHDDPAKVRAHETRREDFEGDDAVEIMLDTFHDRRRAYVFEVNPKGVQFDAIWTEASYAEQTNGNFDVSFDTLWYSRGKITSQGYVAWIAIPFRSLRFPASQDQTWGVVLLREITRENEKAFWPRVSINQEGRLGQAGTAKGLNGISPGRNIQLIPYGLLNSFHSVDDRRPYATCSASIDGCARFQNRDVGGTFGLDGKMILNDSLVLDATANPDFSQVESDEPQVTVNQRYRVYFPEKRPFFIENADYFRTPIDLFFTRNIVDPSGGIRLTGKAGPYSMGILSSDDRAPGLTVSTDDALFKTRDYITIARVARDVFKQSSIGAIYTDWEYPAANSFNRVGGIDSRLKFLPKLTGTLQGVASSTHCDPSFSSYFACSGGNFSGLAYKFGTAYKAALLYTDRHWFHQSTYNDVSPGFFSQPGFVTRVDLREYRYDTSYSFRPKNGPVVSWGPEVYGHFTWDHTGLRLDTDYIPTLSAVLKKQTRIFVTPYEEYRERLRPKDFPVLTQDADFHEHASGIAVSSSPLSQLTLGAQYYWGDAANFVYGLNSKDPQFARYAMPYLARFDQAGAIATIHPFTQLKIDNTYLFIRLRTRETNANIFNNHIIRSKWNWQLNRELSLRVILQYSANLTRNKPGDPANTYPLTFLPTTKNFNTDFLITYGVRWLQQQSAEPGSGAWD